MESLGGFCDGEWENLSLSQELDQSSLILPIMPNNNNSSSWFYSLDAFDPNLLHSSTTTTTHHPIFFPNNSSADLFLSIDDESNNIFGASFLSDVLMDGVDMALAAGEEDCDHRERLLNGNVVHASHPPPPLPPLQVVDSDLPGKEPIALKRKVSNGDFADHYSKKKTPVSKYGQKKKKSEKMRKGEISSSCSSVEEEECIKGGGAISEEQISSISYTSDEENGSQDQAQGGSDDGGRSKRKSRASRGSATDPQSLYARKRRERINERLRILQKLVPNGTKVDISTMLEEAVHYVKFLQLQIKLLSSDEMWMFAPLAYSGMDLGLCQKLSPFLSH